MSIAAFARAAALHGAATESGDFREANRAYDEVVAARNTLKAKPDEGVGLLSVLLLNGDKSVRLWAASYLLETSYEEQARMTLQTLAEGGGIVGFNAGMTLKQWLARRPTGTDEAAPVIHPASAE